ncbi:hypothetical protein DRP53_08965, partial [candidate division WOR-3 bacterium]
MPLVDNLSNVYQRLFDRELIPFVGRSEYIFELNQYLKQIYENKGCAVLITGEGGVGKTRLIDEFLLRIRPKTTTVLRGKVFDVETEPLSPFGSLIDKFLEDCGRKARLAVRIITPDISSPLLNIFPRLRSICPIDVPVVSHDEWEIFSALHRLFENISRLYPTVLFIDDIHCLNPQSRRFLQFFVKRIQHLPIMIVGTSRLHSDDSISGMETIQLKSFTFLETAKFLYHIFGGEFSDRFQRWIHRITKGNPFYIKEFLKDMLRKNVVVYSEEMGSWQVEKDITNCDIPPSVKATIADRFERLTPEKLQFLRMAAIMGERFDPGMIKQALNLGTQKLERIIAELSIDLLIPVVGTNHLQFAHPLYRQVLVEKMSTSELRRLHIKTAAMLQKIRPDDSVSIANHIAAALDRDEFTPRLARLFLNAAKECERTGDLPRAHRFYRLADDSITVLDQSRLARQIVTARMIIAQFNLNGQIYDLERAEAVVQGLIKKGFLKLGFELGLKIYRYLFDQGDLDCAERYIRKFSRMVAKDQLSERMNFRLKVEQCLLWRKRNNIEKARRVLKRLINNFDPEIDFITHCHALNILGLIYFVDGDYEAASDCFARLISISEQLGNVNIKMVGLINLATTSILQGRFDRASSLHIQYAEMIDHTGKEHKLPILWESQALYHILEGSLDQALKLLKQVLRWTKAPYRKVSASLLMTEILLLQRKYTQAGEILEQYRPGRVNFAGMDEWLTFYYRLRSKFLMKIGRLSQASRAVNKALKISEENRFNVDRAQALTLLGLIRYKKAQAPKALTLVKKGLTMLIKEGAVGFLGPLLWEIKGVVKDRNLIRDGVAILREIRATGWLAKLTRSRKNQARILRIRTFGGLQVSRNGILLKNWKSNKARELLCLIL